MASLSDKDRQLIEDAILADQRIEAIKLYREATGAGLADAKQAVESLEANLRGGGSEAAGVDAQNGNFGDQDRKAVENAIFAGRTIEAIKLHRTATGIGLAEAKRAVEEMEVDLRRRSPGKFVAGAQKKGCLGVMVVLVIIGVLVALKSFSFVRS